MVYFVGAGAGDKELITVKGKRLLENADMIIYAGSLVNAELLEYAKEGCEILNSAYMTLDDVSDAYKRAEKEGKTVVRLHTGDPSIFGAIREQMDFLKEEGIEFECVPGVSSFLAAAAALKAEYTLPDVTQTVILTRMEGRTPVPEREKIGLLASHGATMIIFLSVNMIERLKEELAPYYGDDCPVAVVYKASWKDEMIVKGTLSDIAQKVKEKGINKTALVLVGRFLGDEYSLSKLYDKHFETEFRKAEK